MKDYELAEAGRKLMPLLPVVARLDGKSFHRFTRNMRRPYDERLSKLFTDVTAFLVRETNAAIGYCQSDEITLVWDWPEYDSDTFFGGRIQKMCSVLASLCTAEFSRLLPDRFPGEDLGLALFDCRVWSVPERGEAANAVLWREADATKNSISMAARSVYSHTTIHGKSAKEMQELLWQKGINWNDYPAFFKRGTFVQRRTVVRSYTAAELDALPPKHEARTTPDLLVERREVVVIPMPPFARVTNRVAVIFDGVEPEVTESPTTPME